MSTSPATNPRITVSSSSAAIWPWATPTRARGASDWTLAAIVSIVSIRLWTKNTWPPRSSSRANASSSSPSSHGSTKVRIGDRSRGGVSISVRSRSPASERWSVRGNRRRGERQHVHREPERLEPLLVLHAEPVLLVHDEQAEVLEQRRPSRAAGGCR